MSSAPQVVAETATFLAHAKKRMSDAEREEAVLMIASDPTCGDLLKGTGGVRKVRFGTGGRGKSGSVRIVYFFYSPALPIYLLTVFAKNEKSNLTNAERNALAALTAELVRAHQEKP